MKLSKILFYIAYFLRFCVGLYLVFVRGKSYCPKKLGLYVSGFLKRKDCRLHICQYQACTKKTKQCPCGRIKNGELLEL